MPPTPSASSRVAGFAKLAACVVVLAVLFLGVLPAIARRPAMIEQVARHERQHIDPAARYYIDLPGLTEFLDRVQTNRRRAGAALWQPSWFETSSASSPAP